MGNAELADNTPDDLYWRIAKLLDTHPHTVRLLEFFECCAGSDISLAKKRVIFRALTAIKSHAMVKLRSDRQNNPEYFTRLINVYASCCRTTLGLESTRVISVITKLSDLFSVQKLLKRLRQDHSDSARVCAYRKLLVFCHLDVEFPSRVVFKNPLLWKEVLRCMQERAHEPAGSGAMQREQAQLLVATFLEQISMLCEDSSFVLTKDLQAKLKELEDLKPSAELAQSTDSPLYSRRILTAFARMNQTETEVVEFQQLGAASQVGEEPSESLPDPMAHLATALRASCKTQDNPMIEFKDLSPAPSAITWDLFDAWESFKEACSSSPRILHLSNEFAAKQWSISDAAEILRKDENQKAVKPQDHANAQTEMFSLICDLQKRFRDHKTEKKEKKPVNGPTQLEFVTRLVEHIRDNLTEEVASGYDTAWVNLEIVYMFHGMISQV